MLEKMKEIIAEQLTTVGEVMNYLKAKGVEA